MAALRPKQRPSGPSSGGLELRSFSKLVADLDRRGIVTKRRYTKVAKYNGGIPFTYGPLAYFLKNRVYLGQTSHGGKWFNGEHAAIIDQDFFDRVQQVLKDSSNGRKAKRSDSGALLMGKLYDDRGNRMSPSFSTKNGVRYRFYINSALLRGRKDAAGSIPRVAAQEIEAIVDTSIRERINGLGRPASKDSIFERVDHITLKAKSIEVAAMIAGDESNLVIQTFEFPFEAKESSGASRIEPAQGGKPDQKLLQKPVIRRHTPFDRKPRGHCKTTPQGDPSGTKARVSGTRNNGVDPPG